VLETVPTDPVFVARLEELRRLRRRYRLYSWSFFPAVLAYGALVSPEPGLARTLGRVALAGFGLTLLLKHGRLQGEVLGAQCPRCREQFHGPSMYGRLPWYSGFILPWKCPTCGLGVDGRHHGA
jgi:hypothetical protein